MCVSRIAGQACGRASTLEPRKSAPIPISKVTLTMEIWPVQAYADGSDDNSFWCETAKKHALLILAKPGLQAQPSRHHDTFRTYVRKLHLGQLLYTSSTCSQALCRQTEHASVCFQVHGGPRAALPLLKSSRTLCFRRQLE
jgi:hypothetical protein